MTAANLYAYAGSKRALYEQTVEYAMTTDGVALATVISNAISAGILFWILTHSDRAISIHRHKLEIDRKLLREIVRIGLPAGLQSALFSISNICIQSAVNGLGTDVMAASAAAFNLEVIVYYVVNAFGQACTTFTGQNAGAGNPQRCRMVMNGGGGALYLAASDEIQQRAAAVLCGVRYVIEAHFEMTDRAAPTDSEGKFSDIMNLPRLEASHLRGLRR